MFCRIWFAVLFSVFAAGGAFAQSEDEMAVQRCVWACLANSKGANDPAYHSCVADSCEALAGAPGVGADTATVRDVQQALNALGYKAGRADGVKGRKTRRAMQAFAADHGLKRNVGITKEFRDALARARKK